MDSALKRAESPYLEVAHPWVSNDLMPVYRWTFPEEASDAEVFACLEARREWAVNVHYPVAWIVDCSRVKKVTATQRQAFAEHIKWYEPYDARWNAGSALVVPNRWIQGMVTAIFWFSKPGCPHKTFMHPHEAEAWARNQLAARLAEPTV